MITFQSGYFASVPVQAIFYRDWSGCDFEKYFEVFSFKCHLMHQTQCSLDICGYERLEA